MIDASEHNLPAGSPDTLDLLLAKYFRSQQNVAQLLQVRAQILDTGNKVMKERDEAQSDGSKLRAALAASEAEHAKLKSDIDHLTQRAEAAEAELATLRTEYAALLATVDAEDQASSWAANETTGEIAMTAADELVIRNVTLTANSSITMTEDGLMVSGVHVGSADHLCDVAEAA